MAKPELERERRLEIRASTAERIAWRSAAARQDISMSDWIRRVLNNVLSKDRSR